MEKTSINKILTIRGDYYKLNITYITALIKYCHIFKHTKDYGGNDISSSF